MIIFSGIIRAMDAPNRTPPTQRELVGLGITQAYASMLLAGKRTPSLELAKRIEATFGYPATCWPQPERAS